MVKVASCFAQVLSLVDRNRFELAVRRHGAQTQAVLMSIYRTLKARGLEPMDTIAAALKSYVRTGALPSLPQ